MSWRKKFAGNPQALLVSGFAGLIGLGALLLSLPISHQSGKMGFLDALFTSTSAVCVTGLAVVDTGTDFTFFGQIVILLLIQTGGLGVMTFAGLAVMILGGRLSLNSSAALSDTFLQKDAAGEFIKLFKRILLITFTMEGIGAICLFFFLNTQRTADHALFSAIFHSISAFCNAGFSIYSDSLMGLRHNEPAIITLMILIIAGGIGYIVIDEIWRLFTIDKYTRLKKLSHHSRVVLLVSILLIFGGALAIYVAGLTGMEKSFEDQIFNAVFQSVTARTAGFNLLETGKLPVATLFIICLLMFVGGSPGSCAGGIKTTTFLIWLARLKCRLTGRSDTIMFGYTVPVDIVRRVSVLVGMSLLWNIFGLTLLLITEKGIGANMEEIMFEQISAFGTVGLSTGITASLSITGKIWIILTMFIGRLGPLTLALWMIPIQKQSIVYPDGKVMIG